METFRRKIVKREASWSTVGIPLPIMKLWSQFSEVTLIWDESDPFTLTVKPMEEN
jgi:hypothetical protein